jgi:hypothetical protein
MENNTKNGLKAVIVTTGLLAIVYFIFKKKSNMKTLTELQDSVWKHMQKNNTSLLNEYKSSYVQSDAFNNMANLTAWDNAIKNGASTYNYGGKTYNTKDGVAL